MAVDQLVPVVPAVGGHRYARGDLVFPIVSLVHLFWHGSLQVPHVKTVGLLLCHRPNRAPRQGPSEPIPAGRRVEVYGGGGPIVFVRVGQVLDLPRHEVDAIGLIGRHVAARSISALQSHHAIHGYPLVHRVDGRDTHRAMMRMTKLRLQRQRLFLRDLQNGEGVELNAPQSPVVISAIGLRAARRHFPSRSDKKGHPARFFNDERLGDMGIHLGDRTNVPDRQILHFDDIELGVSLSRAGKISISEDDPIFPGSIIPQKPRQAAARHRRALHHVQMGIRFRVRDVRLHHVSHDVEVIDSAIELRTKPGILANLAIRRSGPTRGHGAVKFVWTRRTLGRIVEAIRPIVVVVITVIRIPIPLVRGVAPPERDQTSHPNDPPRTHSSP
jgi:hypothetical protein